MHGKPCFARDTHPKICIKFFLKKPKTKLVKFHLAIKR